MRRRGDHLSQRQSESPSNVIKRESLGAAIPRETLLCLVSVRRQALQKYSLSELLDGC